MKRAILISGLAALLVAAMLAVTGILGSKKGVMETFSELHDPKLGSAYVRGRYHDLLNGWDVSFFHRDAEGRWFSYYLAHEAWRWGRAKLWTDGALIIVSNRGKTIAEYDTRTGAFAHKLQGVTYTKEDGIEGALEAMRRTSTVKLPE
jgi:hypothetical protein